MADELKVIITADASGVGPAVAEATAAVKGGAEAMAAAQAKLSVATAELASLEKMLGGAAVKSGTAMADLADELEANVAAAQALVTATAEATAAEEALTKQTLANSKVQDLDKKATYSRMEAMGSARIAMGAMDGSTGMMANGLARLAAGSQALGPILASMVPVAVVGAGIFLIADLIKGVVEFSEKAEDLAETLGTNWLEGAMDQLDGLGDKIRATEKDIEHLQDAVDTAIEKQKEIQVERIGIANGPQAGAIAQSQVAAQDIQTQRTKLDILKNQLQVARDFSTEQDYARSHPGFLGTGSTLDGQTVDYWAKLWKIPENNMARAGQMAREFQAEMDKINAQIETESLQTSETLEGVFKPDVDKPKREKSDNMPEQIARAQIEAAHAADAELGAQQQIVAAMDKQIELNNLKARTSKEGTAAERETLRVMENQLALGQAKEKIAALGSEMLTKTFQEEQKADAEARKRQEEQAKAALEETNRVREQQIAAARETAAALIEAANQEFERTQVEIRGQEELGIISHRVAEQRLLDALKLREATTQGALKTEQGLFNPIAGEKEAIEYKKLEDQMTKEAQRAALERERIVQQEATKMEQAYKKAANEFNADFTRAFNEWATKSQTAGQAFGHMLGDMELQVVDFVARWILQKAEMWAMDKLLQVSGMATQVAVQKTANVAMVSSDAGVAAAGAMAYYSAINPPEAPAMAALQFAETMAYAVMDTGGMMPHMGFAFNTSGSAERVLSPSQTSNFESLVNNGGSRVAHLHQTNNYGGAPTKEMHEAQTAHTINRLKSMLRPEAFA